MAYPNTYDEFRETENRPDVVYDPNQKRRVYAEDINNATAAIAAIQATLGLKPDDGYGTVAEFVKMVNQLASDAFDHADQALTLAEQQQASIEDLQNRVTDLENRVSNLGG